MPRRWHFMRLLSLFAWLLALILGTAYLMQLYPGWEVLILIGTLFLTVLFIVIDLAERDRVLNRKKQYGREEQD